MTLTSAATALATASALLGTPVNADMGVALSLCLDTTLNIPARAAAFEELGWSPEGDETRLREIFAAGVTLGSLDALDPSTWSGTHTQAFSLSQQIVRMTASRDALALTSPDEGAAVVLLGNANGLQVCHYFGNDPGLGRVAHILDGSILREIGSVQRIRGDGPKSSISAHFLDDAGRAQIKPPLRYGATFMLVLDRQPGDLQ